ncbi:MAG TPA: hypothetical protein VHM26_06045, partial [Chitinophagaceae bacterium]|nr:hypothetical protein [Chitinophagaceae bacterium]
MLAINVCYSQGTSNDGALQELRKTPTAPAPNAAALGKFGDIPVSLSTGIPSISIPFYTYEDKQKGLNLSVQLSYHAGGNKVEDMPSNVGLGWALSAGGVISRTMRGRPDDEFYYGYIGSAVLPNHNTLLYQPGVTIPSASTPISEGICQLNSSDHYIAKTIAEATMDGETDIYQFSIGAVSGKFYFRKTGDIVLVTQSNLKITYTRSGGNSYFTEFVVTDGTGIKYIFNKPEWTDAQSNDPTPPTPPAYISSWYISKIISADGQDEILFTYSGTGALTYEGAFSDSYKTKVVGSSYSGTEMTSSYRSIITTGQRISAINFPDGTELEFQYNFSRLDYVGDNGLTAVLVKNQGLQKRFNLSYDYFESPVCYTGTGCTPPLAGTVNDWYKRLRLKSVQQTDGTLTLPPYTFEYNATPLPH